MRGVDLRSIRLFDPALGSDPGLRSGAAEDQPSAASGELMACSPRSRVGFRAGTDEQYGMAPRHTQRWLFTRNR